MGAGAASEDAASGEERPGSASEEARLRSGSGKAEEEEEERDREAAAAAAEGAEPGRRRVSVSAVSSKSSPEAPEDSVELRSVSTDMAGGWARGAGRRRRKEKAGKEKEKAERPSGGGGGWFGYSGPRVTHPSGRESFCL